MKRRFDIFKPCIVSLIVLIFIPLSINALDPDEGSNENSYKGPTFWFNAGIGYNLVSDSDIAAGLSLSFPINKILITMRHIKTENFNPLGAWSCGCCGPPDDETYLTERALMGGLFSDTESSLVSFSCGVGTVQGRVIKHYRCEVNYLNWIRVETPINTIGLSLESQVFIRASSFFGLGISFFANINREQTMRGALFELQFGKLR